MLRGPLQLLMPLAGIVVATGAWAATPRQVVDLTIAEARAAMLTDPARARDKAAIAERQSGKIDDAGTRAMVLATALWLEGEAAYRLKRFDEAAPKLRRALALVRARAPGSKLEGDVLLSSASMHGEKGDVVAALAEFQRAHTIYMRAGDSRNRAITLICMASLYGDAKDYDAALKYLTEALAAYDGDPGLSVAMNNNRGTVLQYLGRFAEAERGFRAALAIADTMQSTGLRLQILRNIALTQLKRNDPAAANRTIARIKAIADDAKGPERRDVLDLAAQAAFQRKEYAQAARLIEQYFAGVDLSGTTMTLRESHDTAYHVFRKVGRSDLAFAHLLAVKRLDDQSTRLATSSNAALMAARFDFANQELRIARLKADDLERRVATERSQARMQRYIFYGGAATTAIVIAALLAGLIVVRRSRDKVRAVNADLGLANAALGKALAAKTEFLATTSHEIRTPLNGILGMTQVMLSDPTLAGDLRERLTVVQGAGTTMRALVDDILDVAKIENGKLVLEDAPFDLRGTILEATRLWDVQAGAKGIAFRRELDSCPSTVRGDAARVRQVVFNLLSNALKFTDAGEIAISADRLADGRVAIAVRDSGIGIPGHKLQAIFESFRQADAGTTRRFGGTGLGLAICRQLAQAMGGDVNVESRLGEGSVFTVTLPLPDAAVVRHEATEATPEPALLVVERNPISRSLFRTLLEPHAGRIVFASDAAEALAAMRDDPVSRVLVDDATLRTAEIPAAALRAIVEEAGADVGVVLLWPATDDAERQMLLDTGIERLLTKPVNGPHLIATLFRDRNDPLVSRAA